MTFSDSLRRTHLLAGSGSPATFGITPSQIRGSGAACQRPMGMATSMLRNAQELGLNDNATIAAALWR